MLNRWLSYGSYQQCRRGLMRLVGGWSRSILQSLSSYPLLRRSFLWTPAIMTTYQGLLIWRPGLLILFLNCAPSFFVQPAWEPYKYWEEGCVSDKNVDKVSQSWKYLVSFINYLFGEGGRRRGGAANTRQDCPWPPPTHPPTVIKVDWFCTVITFFFLESAYWKSERNSCRHNLMRI